MASQQDADSVENLSILDVVTFILSIYALVALLVQSLVPLTPEAITLIERVDLYVCVVFLADFFVNLHRAPSKRAFLKWGWIDLVSSVPMLDVFRAGRAIRVIRIFRTLRALRSTNNILNHFLRNRKGTSFASIITISFLLLIFGSIAMLQFETSAEANIKTPVDALWWAYTTITTVGYGDKFPVSIEGKIVAAILMTMGVGLFGTFTGFIASLFVEPDHHEEKVNLEHLTLAIQALSAQVQSLESKLETIKESG
jgi:voltage-gated potassium channel